MAVTAITVPWRQSRIVRRLMLVIVRRAVWREMGICVKKLSPSVTNFRWRCRDIPQRLRKYPNPLSENTCIITFCEMAIPTWSDSHEWQGNCSQGIWLKMNWIEKLEGMGLRRLIHNGHERRIITASLSCS